MAEGYSKIQYWKWKKNDEQCNPLLSDIRVAIEMWEMRAHGPRDRGLYRRQETNKISFKVMMEHGSPSSSSESSSSSAEETQRV